MRIAVTGGAGFIGSNLTDTLLSRGDEVVVVDNFSTGRREHLAEAGRSSGLTVCELDLVGDRDELAAALDGSDAVVHLAANADVRFGWDDTRRDLTQNVVALLNVVDAMAEAGVERILLASSGSVYGECPVVPTPEDAPFPQQTSLYGASKVAAEGFLGAWAEAGRLSATVFRFVSILGPRYSHGHVIDFMAQLREHPDELVVQGDGSQQKSYLDVSDCVAALIGQLHEKPSFEVFNLGVDDRCTVSDSIGWITERLALDPRVTFAGGDRGWVGDNPLIHLDTSRISATGWAPVHGIREAVERTVDYLVAHPWMLEGHKPRR